MTTHVSNVSMTELSPHRPCNLQAEIHAEDEHQVLLKIHGGLSVVCSISSIFFGLLPTILFVSQSRSQQIKCGTALTIKLTVYNTFIIICTSYPQSLSILRISG